MDIPDDKLPFSATAGGGCAYVDWHSGNITQEREDDLSKEGSLGIHWTDEGYLHLYLTRETKLKNAFTLILDGNLAQELYEILKTDLGKSEGK